MRWELNLPQTVFTVFYAIFWGVVANAQPRWKAFNWPVGFSKGRRRVFWRAVIALLLLNVVPITLYVLLVFPLQSKPAGGWTFAGGRQLVLAIVAAVSPFGVHRLWISTLERFRERLYFDTACRNAQILTDGKRLEKEQEPSWEELGLRPEFARGNLLIGAAYVVIAFGAAYGG
jgi:hypothetical protein